MKAENGFTLVEMLIVTVIMGITAAAAVPMMSSGDPQKLNVAAEETTNLLRFALSEARRTGGYVLVDGKSAAGQLSLYNSNSSGNLNSVVNDPLTKRAATLDVSLFAPGVTLLPQFQAGGSPYAQMLIGPGLTQLQVFNGIATNVGLLQPGSSVLLSYGGQSVAIAINELTGLVTLP